MPNNSQIHMMKMTAQRHPKLRWQVRVTAGGHNKTAVFWQTLPPNKHPRWDSGHTYRQMPKGYVVQQRWKPKAEVIEKTKELVAEMTEKNATAMLYEILDVLYFNDVLDSETHSIAIEYIDMDMSKRDVQDVVEKIKKEVNG